MRACKFTGCCSQEMGLLIMVMMDLVLLVAIVFVLMSQLGGFIDAVQDFDYEGLRDLVLFSITGLAICFALLKCGIGACALCRKAGTLPVKQYFCTTVAADIMFLLALALRLVFQSIDKTSLILFAVLEGVAGVYDIYCVLLLYSYLEDMRTAETARSDRMQNIAKKIVEDVGLSVIPEISAHNEISSRI